MLQAVRLVNFGPKTLSRPTTCNYSALQNMVRQLVTVTPALLTSRAKKDGSHPVIPYRLMSQSPSDKSVLPLLTLYTKDPCPLCDEALETLSPLLSQVTLEKVDITKPGNEQWWKAYKYEIPVFHFEGKFLMKHRANVDLLRKAIDDFYEDCFRD